MGIRILGPLLIACAAILWGTDSFFRNRALASFDPLMLVFLDHLLGFAVLSLWAGFRHGVKVFALSGKEWASAAFVGVCGSAIATVLFTSSFQFVNPSLPVLLQKLQPVFVIALAALLWAGATVAGKALLRRTPSTVAVFWRYVFGSLTLGIVLALKHRSIPIEIVSSKATILPVLALALFSGLIPMVFYYSGLARTTASTATFMELVYPVSAVFLNLIFLEASLTPVQWVAGSVLLMAVTSLSL